MCRFKLRYLRCSGEWILLFDDVAIAVTDCPLEALTFVANLNQRGVPA